MDLLEEIDEAIGWVENEYGFVTDVLRKAREEIERLRRLLAAAQTKESI